MRTEVVDKGVAQDGRPNSAERLRGAKSLPIPRRAGGIALRGAYLHEEQVRVSERGGPYKVRSGGGNSSAEREESVESDQPVAVEESRELRIAHAAEQSGHLVVSHSSQPANDARPGPENFIG